MKTYLYYLIVFLILSFKSFSQNEVFLDPDSILIGNKIRPKVLLVGTWHFNYPGQDAHKSKESNKINILSDKRQKELEELLDYIAKFRPTKIAVESGRNTGYLKWRLKQWLLGKRELKASELEQIGIRLMHKLKLDTIYGSNAYPLLLELDDNKVKPTSEPYLYDILERHYFGGSDSISKRYDKFYEYQDTFAVKHTLLESFKYFNSDKVLDRGFGSYISGGQFFSENNEGPDALSSFWFNRNLRIYRNIQRIDYNENDRILVLFGSGHVSILKWLFKCDPNFELVKFNSLSLQD